MRGVQDGHFGERRAENVVEDTAVLGDVEGMREDTRGDVGGEELFGVGQVWGECGCE